MKMPSKISKRHWPSCEATSWSTTRSWGCGTGFLLARWERLGQQFWSQRVVHHLKKSKKKTALQKSKQTGAVLCVVPPPCCPLLRHTPGHGLAALKAHFLAPIPPADTLQHRAGVRHNGGLEESWGVPDTGHEYEEWAPAQQDRQGNGSHPGKEEQVLQPSCLLTAAPQGGVR